MNYKKIFGFSKIIVGAIYVILLIAYAYVLFFQEVGVSNFIKITYLASMAYFSYTLIRNGFCELGKYTLEKKVLLAEIILGCIFCLLNYSVFVFVKNVYQSSLPAIFFVLPLILVLVLFVIRSSYILKHFDSIIAEENVDNYNGIKD